MADNTDGTLNLTKLIHGRILPSVASTLKPHKLIGMSNAECMIDVFPDWVRRCFSSPSALNRCYRPYDLNMPVSILRRSRAAHNADSPLTEFGKISASIRATELRRTVNVPQQIFCSPELRSVETAQAISTRLAGESKASIFVDPSLSEWRNFDESHTEKHWLSAEQLMRLGYQIDGSYRPIRAVSELPTSETPQQYFDRIVEFLVNVVQNYEGCSLIVGSSATLSLLKGKIWRNGTDLQRILAETQSCSVVIGCIPRCQPNCSHPLLPFTHCLSEAQNRNTG